MKPFLLLLVSVAALFATDSNSSAAPAQRIDSLMEYIKDRPTLSKRDIENKKEGTYFTGLPLLNFDPDKGTGYGVRVYWYDNGNKKDPLFTYTPYRHQLFLQYFQTDNGWTYNWFHYNAPYIANTRFRFTGSLVYERNTQMHYYGTGTTTLGDLVAPDGQTFTSFDSYQEHLDALGSPYYNRYDFTKPYAELNLQYDVAGGLVRIATGLYLSKATIVDYANTQVNGEENNASKLTSNEFGYNGGVENGFRIGVVYDTRDFTPNPKSGSEHDLMLEFFTPMLGSDYTYQQYTFSTKNFYTPSFMPVTLAGQFVYVAQYGDVPFYSQSAIGYSDDTKYGLGGLRSLRGFEQDRFVGKFKSFVNLEARWHMFGFGSSQHFDFMLVPFIDSGRVFDRLEDTTLKEWKTTQGAGLRIAWNQATIIMIDYGTSSEGSGLYINFEHIF